MTKNFSISMQWLISKLLVLFLPLIISNYVFAQQENDCLRVYNEGQAHWVKAKKMDETFMENAQAFIKGTQTCEGLIVVIKESINVYQEFEKANGRFMTAELEYCPKHKMNGYEKSAKLKQQTIRDRMDEIFNIFVALREEAVRVNCIGEDDLKMPRVGLSW